MSENKSWRNYLYQQGPEKSTSKRSTGTWRDYLSGDASDAAVSGNWRDYIGKDVAEAVGKYISGRVNTWVNNHNALLSDYQNRFSGRKYSYEDAYVSDSASYLDTVSKQKSDFDAEADSILAYIDQYKGFLNDDWVKSVRDTLTGARDVQVQIVEGATRDNAYWNTFTPTGDQTAAGYTAEKVYKERQAGQKQYANDMSLDIDAAKLELEGLKKEKTAYLEDQTQQQEDAWESMPWWKKIGIVTGLIPDTSISIPGVNPNSVGTPSNPYDKQISEKEQQIARATYVQGYAGYMDNVDASDYVTGSQYESTRTNTPLDDAKYTVDYGSGTSYEYSKKKLFGDFLYDYINKNEDALTVASSNDTTDYSYFLGLDKGFLQTMKDKEIGVFNYLYKKNKEDAYAYLDFLESDLQGRRRIQEQEKWAEYAKESPVGSSVFSTLISPLKGISYVSQAVDMLDDGKMQENAGYNRFSYIPSTIRSQVSSTIENSGKWGEVGSFAYNTGMSMADFVFTTAVSGGNQALSLAIMGTGAAADATLSAKDRGLDDGQAFALGTIAGLAEVAMEKISLGAWLEGDMTEGALRYVLKNALSEGGEEASTSVINLLADVIIAGDKSEWNMAMQAYIDAGKPPEEAFGLVAAEQAAQIGLDTLGGILSGAAIGGGTYAATSTAAEVQYGDIGKNKVQTQRLAAEGVELNPTSQYVQKAQSKVEKGKNLTGMQVRNILAANQEKITANDLKKIQQAAEKRLTNLGQTENVSEVAEIATKWATGQEITRAEKRVLTHSQYGSRVANELLPENIASEDYSTDWAEEIGTESVNKAAYNKKAIRTLIDAMANAEDPATYKPLEERAGTESALKVSKSGQANIRGETVDLRKAEVVDFVKDKKGNVVDMTVNIGGKEVKASEIDYADGDQSYLFDAVSKIENITPADATVIVRDYDPSSGQSVGEYLNGIDEGYTYGYYGYSEADLKAGNFAPKLMETQMKTAYELGKFARKNSVDADETARKRMRTAAEAAVSQTEKTEQQKARVASNDAEVYYQDGKSVVKFDEHTGKYDDKRMAAVNTAKFLAKLGIGGKYYFYESYTKDGVRVYKDANGNEVEAPNGIYKEADGSIHIDLNAGNAGQGTALFTLGHELTHFVKDQSKKQFEILGELVTAAFDKTDISMHERVLEKQKFLESKRGKKVSYDEAFEEVVADAMSTMLSDGSFYDLIMEIRVKDKGLFATIKRFFNKMIARFKKVYEQLTPDQRDARDIREMKDAFDNIQKAFAEALVEASENFQATQAQKNTTEDGGVKEQARPSVKNPNRLDPRSVTREDVRELLQNAEAGLYAENTYIPVRISTPGIVQERLFAEDLPMAMPVKKIKQEFEPDLGPVVGKNVRGHELTVDELLYIIEMLDSPDYLFSQADGRGVAVLLLPGSPVRKTVIVDFGQNINASYMNGYDGDKYNISITAFDIDGGDVGLFMKQLEKGWNKVFDKEKEGDPAKKFQATRPFAIEQDSLNENVSQPDASVKEKLSDRDSQGNQLSKEQMAFFAQSQARDSDGHLLVLYHQTDADFTIFDVNHPGAGRSDGDTPFGIFLKRTAGDIGLRGKKQMALYANITNPLRAATREELSNRLREISSRYAAISDQHKKLDAEYHEKFEQAKNAWRDYLVEWRAANPDASRTAAYDDPKFSELFDAEEMVVDEWTAAADRLSVQAKEAITEDLQKAGYDGIFLENDVGSWGRKTDAIIALNPNQVKDVSNKTPSANPDIRYSYRGINKDGIEVYETSEEVKNLPYKERQQRFLSLMANDYRGRTAKFVRNGHTYYATFDEKDVNKNIYGDKRSDKKGYKAKINVGADGDIFELVENAKYNGSLAEKGKKIAAHRGVGYWDYFIKNVQIDGTVFNLTANVRKKADGAFVYSIQLNENKKIKASPPLGLLSKALNGVTNASTNNVTQQAPKVNSQNSGIKSERGEDTSNRSLLANAFEGLSKSSVEYGKLQEYRDNIKVLNLLEDQLAELNTQIREIRFTKGKYDATKLQALEEKAERIAKDINKQDKVLLNMEASGPLRKVVEFERKKAAQKTKEHIKEIQENKKARAEQTELRHKIRRAVRDLNKLLNRGNKKTNVKEDMKGFVSKALELADYLFTDHISNDELIRKGINPNLMRGNEPQLVKETEEILSQLYDNADSLTDEEFTRLDAKRKANEDKLKNLLTAQRNERLNTPVYNLFNDLVTEYASLNNSSQEAVKGAYDPKVEEFLRSYLGETNGETDSDRKTILQNMRVADMTTEELWKLHNAYTMVLHSVRNANKRFVTGKTESLEATANNIAADFSKRKAPDGKASTVLRNLSNKIGWNYEKLYYALDRIGSEAFTELVMNIANSENTVMRDVIEAADFRDKTVKKYGFNNWAVNKEIDREFLDTTGKKFKLTLGQLMALYAYSRREGAWDHIEYGGFVFGEAALTNPKPADSYKLTREQCEAITNTLTKMQKGYVEEMQKFLSETMGAKGNEVSLLLYGIKMFGEKNYFPIHIAGQFKAQANESQAKAAAGFSTMTNAGFTHAQNPNAKAPFVLEGFNEVWADHVNEMSRYHGAVPALEDMRRVMNRSSYSEADSESVAIKQLMENSFGKEAVAYFDNLYREANSGALTEKMEKWPKKLLSLFRKNSVAYSLSVIIQQPSAMVRAYAMIDKKYFGYNHRGPFKTTAALSSGIAKAVSSKWNPAYANAYNEMLKYAPGVTMAKEIGGFDTHTGSSIREYLLDTDKSFKQSMKTENLKGKGKALLDLVDDNAIANLPNVADKIAWIEIWNACKRETVAKHKDLATNSDEFMQIVGDRFTEVIRATQVYDSIFSKSPMLKSKSIAVQYVVSFMNEPNTTANMVEKAVRDAIKGNWKGGLRIAAAVTSSIIFNNVLKAIIYAMRDDDEDENYIEKYIEAVTGGLMDDFTAFNYIPLARDIWSLAQGYDVERADMAIVSDAIDAVGAVVKNAFTDTDDMTEEQLIAFDKKCIEANWKLAESLVTFFGIPVKNIRREINGVVDCARIASANVGKSTAGSAFDKVIDSVIDSIPFMKVSNKADKLYDAIASGDDAYVDRIKASYKNNDAYQSAVRKALRENDPRVHEAAQAGVDGNFEERNRIYREIKGDLGSKYASQIVDAINDETDAIKKESEPDKVKSQYSTDQFVSAVIEDDLVSAQAMKDDIIDAHKANGKSQKDAEKAFKTSVESSIKMAYTYDELDETQAEKMLQEYAGKDEKEAASKVSYWSFLNAHPEYEQYDLSEANVEKYLEYAEPADIPMDVFVQFRDGTKGLADIKDEWGDVEVSKRDQVLEVIDSLPITRKQKDALYLAARYSESKIWDVPW